MERREPATYEVDGPHINAPDWPWWTAGLLVVAAYIVFVVVAYGRA